MARVTKQAQRMMSELFEPTPQERQQVAVEAFVPKEAVAEQPVAEQPDPTSCPKCGGKTLVSARPRETGGTRYCCVCTTDGEPYYFTPCS